MSKKKTNTVDLVTDFEKDLEKCDIPFSEYPRPQFRRESYLCLNGIWDFIIEKNGKTEYSGSITVPFCPESRLSGVKRETESGELLIYERRLTIGSYFLKEKTLLHVGASDQYTRVILNGKEVGRNEGGYLPFSCDVSGVISEGENHLRIEVSDPLCLDLPYGKQSRKRGGMWYTRVSGIWQTVWLESMPQNCVESIKLSPDLRGVDLEIRGGAEEKLIVLGKKEYRFSGDRFRIDVDAPKLWTPENPHLYEFELISGEDRISSYFALRTVSIAEFGEKPLICLNEKPIFCHGLLDQGYFPDGIFLPASPRGFKEDILRMKKCGFNTLRKHIKLEPELFYYYCDKYGMLVFQDMINNGRYSFIIDTALPTLFLKRGISHRATKKRREAFETTSLGIIEQLYNHPSVVYYTIFNEGWGQYAPKELYAKLRSRDPSRIYDTTSGWFKVSETDVESDHVYFKPIKLKSVKGKPMVLSEFGGYACKIAGHSFNPDKTYGYKFLSNEKEFEDALLSLYEKQVLPAIDQGLCATVLTQISDVEDETNGLLTYDRKILKADERRLNELAATLYGRFKIRFD